MSIQCDEFARKMNNQLDVWNSYLDALEKNAYDSEIEIRDSYFSEIFKIRFQSKLARQQLEDIRIAGEQSWEKMVMEMDKISNAFRYSFIHFKSQV